jgi:hypothetical protein
MPVIQNTVSIAANATNENVIQGSQFEYLPYNALCEFGLLGAATGLVADVYSGADIVAESYALAFKAGFPVYPDDYNLNDVAAAGDRLKVRVRNTTGAAIVLSYSVRLTPV